MRKWFYGHRFGGSYHSLQVTADKACEERFDDFEMFGAVMYLDFNRNLIKLTLKQDPKGKLLFGTGQLGCNQYFIIYTCFLVGTYLYQCGCPSSIPDIWIFDSQNSGFSFNKSEERGKLKGRTASNYFEDLLQSPKSRDFQTFHVTLSPPAAWNLQIVLSWETLKMWTVCICEDESSIDR